MSGNTINVQGSYIDIHDNEVVNLNIDKATVTMDTSSAQAPVVNTPSDTHKEIADRLFKLAENGEWEDGITAEDIKGMLAAALGVGEVPLTEKEKELSEKLWAMLEGGRGGDRIRITWQNIVGYLLKKKLLKPKSAPEINIDFFGDKNGSDNINKGRNGRLAEVTQLLDAHVPKIDKKR